MEQSKERKCDAGRLWRYGIATTICSLVSNILYPLSFCVGLSIVGRRLGEVEGKKKVV
jgi:hypothetical protein